MEIGRIAASIAAAVALAAAGLPGNAEALSCSGTGLFAGDPSSELQQCTLTAADVGSSLELDWIVPQGTDGLPLDLAAEAIMTIDLFTPSMLDLTVKITNTTDLSAQENVMSFGFGVRPDVTATYLVEGDVFDRIGDGAGPLQTFPGGFKFIDVCVFGQNCAGGALSQGLAPGDSDTFTIRLHGDFGSAPATALLHSFPLKFQGEFGSFEPACCNTAVPEPTSGILLGAGALIVASFIRRREIA